jgi:hypothetical protein
VQCYDYGVVGTGPLGLVSAQALSQLSGAVLLLGPIFSGSIQSHLALSRQTLIQLQQLGFKGKTLSDWIGPCRLLQTLVLGSSDRMGWAIRSKYFDFLGLNIPQNNLQQALEGLLSPNITRCADKISLVSPLPQGGYQLQSVHGESFYVKKLIAADGAHSLVRTTLRPRWEFFQKSLINAVVFSHGPGDLEDNTAYQYADRKALIASLPQCGSDSRYAVWTGSSIFPWTYSNKSIPLWNYQVSLESSRDCAYVGWAGQSFDPNSAAGMNQAIWEIGQLCELWGGKQNEKIWLSWKAHVQQRRSQVASLVIKNRWGLSMAFKIPRAILKAHLELFTGQPLDLSPCFCPSMLI